MTMVKLGTGRTVVVTGFEGMGGLGVVLPSGVKTISAVLVMTVPAAVPAAEAEPAASAASSAANFQEFFRCSPYERMDRCGGGII